MSEQKRKPLPPLAVEIDPETFHKQLDTPSPPPPKPKTGWADVKRRGRWVDGIYVRERWDPPPKT